MKVLVDRYRCPEEFVNFSTIGDLSGAAGYFRFGRDAVCYGQSSMGSRSVAAKNNLHDLSSHVQSRGSTVYLPFDASQVVDNLRLERYTENGDIGKPSILSSDSIQKMYYFVRPFLDVPVRKHLQKLFLRNWEELPFPSWPVDTTVEHIFETLLSLSMKAGKTETIPFIWFWPEGAPSCAIVTHDVETKTGADCASRLMDIDDAFGIKASFQVIPQKQYSVPIEFLNEIRRRGFELNVQDLNHDGNLFDDRQAFLERARSINRYVRQYRSQGFRAGKMHRNADWLEALDISYDMSIPNVAHLEPQRGGCCTVFPYFIGKILELPLTTSQDYSLFHILGSYSTELWKRQISLIQEKHGLASFIVHPDYIMKNRAQEVYKDLLGQLAVLRDEEKMWIPLPRDLNRWWRERSQMKLVRYGNGWQIKGPGNERARLAYASLDGDRVVYNIEEPARAKREVQLTRSGR